MEYGETSFNKAKPDVTDKQAEYTMMNIKQNLQFGSYKWRVLDRQGNKVLMITEDVLENCVYHNNFTSVTWETCDLRKYLNSDFLQSFSEKEQRQIAETSIINPNNPQHRTSGGKDTTDKVFLLSIEEAHRYFSDNSDRKANDWWWLRSPGHGDGLAACVDGDGFINVNGYNAYDIHLCGPRPALIITR
ncbi:MAG: DUF6273 domain-containing protein [Holophagaceae bacterium]|nr:DUF6273 domain-containing protein [Holophagaceae bacterium]